MDRETPAAPRAGPQFDAQLIDDADLVSGQRQAAAYDFQSVRGVGLRGLGNTLPRQ